MSLLTGEKRTASIKANEDTKVLLIGKQAFQNLLIADETLLNQFVDGLERNKSGLAKAIEEELKNSTATRASAKEMFISQIKTYLLLD